jgi:hypothetical protein
LGPILHFGRGSATVHLVWLGLLLSLCAGCEDKIEEMSEYPYYVETLTRRWEVARESFASDDPDLNLPRVLLRDLEGTIDAMERGYNGPNREEAIADLKSIYTDLRTEFLSQVELQREHIVLRPGHEASEVGASIEKAYRRYQDFLPLVEQ